MAETITGGRLIPLDDQEPESVSSTGGKLVPSDDGDNSSGGLTMHWLSGFNKAVYMATGMSGYEEIAKVTGIADWQKRHGDIGGFLKEWTGLSYEPSTQGERVAQRAGQDAVLGVIAAAGTVVTAGATTAVPVTAPIAQRSVGMMVDAARKSPFLASLADVYGWSAFGGASEYVKEEGGGPTAQMMAGMGAAGLPALPALLTAGGKSIVKGATNAAQYTPSMIGIRWLWNTFGKPAAEATASKQVAKALESGTRNKAATDEAYALFDRIGTTRKPTIAEASGSPQLLAAQHAIEKNASGTRLDKLVERKLQLAQEVVDKGSARGPDKAVSAEGRWTDPEIIAVSARSELGRMRKNLDQRLSELDAAKSAMSERIPETDRLGVGATLRDKRGALKKAETDRYSEKAAEIGLNDQRAFFDITPLKTAVDREFFGPRSQLSSKDRPSALNDLHNLRPQKKGAPIEETWRGLQEYRRRLDDDITEAVVAGRRGDVRSLVTTKKMLDDFVATAEPAAVNPQSWSEFRAGYRTDVIERFETGTAYKIGQRGKHTPYLTKDEVVADAFLRSESTVRDFFRLYDGDQEAMLAMRSAIFDRASKASVIDGSVNPNKLSAFLHSNKKVLDNFPDIRNALASTRNSVVALSRREAVMRSRADDIETSSLRKVVELLSREGFDSVMDAAMKDPLKMRALVRAAERTGPGKRPVAAAVWDRALTHIGAEDLPSAKALRTFVEGHRPTLDVALGKEHTKNIEDIYAALDVVGGTPIPAGQPLTEGPLAAFEQATGTGISQLSSRIFAVKSGRLGHKWMAVDLGSRLANKWGQKKAEALMYEALFDDAVAKELSSIARTGTFNSISEKRINSYLFNMGLGGEEQ